jgi:phage tail sheath protein FI
MAVNYLHGVETVELKKGPVPVAVVKSAVIGLIGIAPKGDRNKLILVQNATDAAQLGEQLPGFTIPQALDAIFSQGAGTVLVINVLDDTDNLVAVADEAHVITNGVTKTTAAPIKDFVLKDSDGDTTFVLGTDYTVDDFGNITVLNFTAIPEGSTVEASYKKLDASTVETTQIIGSYDPETDTRTGLRCFDLAFALFGFTPKILIAPGYSTDNAIKEALIIASDKFRGRALLDAPAGTTPSGAIAGRGPAGEINFYTSSKRAVLLYPMVKAFDPASGASQDRPYSQFFAGVWAATINTDGYWFSPSNREMRGVTGLERSITWAINDPQTDANLLNEKGIVTVAAGYGTGIRTWGNRSAAWPTNTAPENFLSVQLTADVIHESIELAMLPFIDRPINNAIVDSILESVNAFLRTLVSRGAIVDGRCSYDPAKNPPTEIALGHLTFDLTFMPPTPAERITFESFIDINLLNSIGQ